ncbi:MAG: FAD-dependent catabolic D-arginine dehydrogenase DauA [Candidatus Binatia bacterium]|nr:MAG: FAD-dependent catabolic D-arginine dehydrogenase DauA [Candidatus Binatia bacterium]
MNTADIVIVGAGFAGAATAFHLARRGAGKIVVLEREAVPGYHASGRNAALGFTSIDEWEAATLAQEGLAFIRGEASTLAKRPLFRDCGSLLVASVPQTAGRLQSLVTRLPEGAAWWDASEAVRAVPVLAESDAIGGLWSPGDAVVDIHGLLQVYIQEARARGAQILFSAPVCSVKVAHGKIAEVHTPSGAWSCGTLVNAAGAWASELGRLADSPVPPLQPRRRHLFIGKPGFAVDPHWPFVWHADVDTYFRPEGDGLLLSPCDATPHPAVEPRTDEHAKLLLAEKLMRAFPRLMTMSIAQGWACLRTFARDERFVIGRDPAVQGLVWVAGLGGHGMTSSYAAGRLGAAAALRDWSEELAWFDPARLVGC